MKTIIIVAGGTPPKRVVPANFIIGVDQGALWLLRHGMTPDVAIGDFDSVTKKQKKYIHDHVKKYIEYPPQKDETDLELAAFQAIKQKPKEVWIYGAIGTRFDHVIGGIQVLLKLASYNICGYLVDKTNEIQIVRRELTLKRLRALPYVSIFPIGEKAIVSLSGFHYNVSHRIFRSGSTHGVSNEITGRTAQVLVHTGEIFLIRSRD